MACHEYEQKILEYVDDSLPEADRTAVEAHLAVCEACAQFHAEATELDHRLSVAFSAPALSDGFDESLRQRIATVETGRSPASRAEQERRWNEEYHRGMDRLRTPFALFRPLLDLVGTWTVIGVAVCVAIRASERAGGAVGGIAVPTLVLGVCGLLVALGTLGLALRRRGVPV